MYRIRRTGELVDSDPKMKEYLTHFQKVFQSMATKSGKPLSKHTIDSYVARYNRLHVLVEGKPVSSTSLAWLSDSDKVIKTLRESDLGSKKDYLSGVIKLLTHNESDPAIIKKYSESLVSFKETEDKKRGDNKANADVVDGFVDLEEVDKRINSFLKNLSKITDDELVKLLIVVMYYKNTFVPRNDLGQFKMISKAKSKTMNPEFNYVITDKRETSSALVPIAFVMQSYKTAATYGKQRFEVSDIVRKVMAEYFKRWNKANGDYLFVNLKNEPFSKTHFLHLLKGATETILGKPQTVDGIRRAIITEFYKTPMRTINEKETFAKRFLHSVKKSEEYMSTNLTGDE